MEIGVEVVTQSATGEDEYLVRILGGRYTIDTVWASCDRDIKRWVRRIYKTHRRKLRRRKLIVALAADWSFNCANGRRFWRKLGKSTKGDPYDLLEICVERDVLLCHLDAQSCSYTEKWFPKALKDLLNDNGVTVVGVGIEEFARKMGKDYGWIMTNKVVELRDLASQKVETQNDNQNNREPRDFSRFKVAALARVVLGEAVNLVKPVRMNWWDPSRPGDRLSVDMVKYATVEVFLVSLMAAKLLGL